MDIAKWKSKNTGEKAGQAITAVGRKGKGKGGESGGKLQGGGTYTGWRLNEDEHIIPARSREQKDPSFFLNDP